MKLTVAQVFVIDVPAVKLHPILQNTTPSCEVITRFKCIHQVALQLMFM